jgi:hypothetical protein
MKEVNGYKILVWEAYGKLSLRRLRRLEDNIKMNLTEI